MTHIQRLLLPVDFSDCTEVATQFACRLARQLQGELHALHVLETYAAGAPLFVGGLALPSVSHEPRPAAEQALESLLARPTTVGIPITRAIVDGSPAEQIIEYARRSHVDLIVMGSHGRGGLAHLLLGSVAERVMREAPCPVLVVRHGT